MFDTKWMAFIAFIWFFGMIFGSIYEGSSLETYAYRYQDPSVSTNNTATESMTATKTFDYLLNPKNITKDTNLGAVSLQLPSSSYLSTWMGMFLLDFNFLKQYNSSTGSWNETIQSYFFKFVGVVGLFSLVMAFIQVIQGFIPGT